MIADKPTGKLAGARFLGKTSPFQDAGLPAASREASRPLTSAAYARIPPLTSTCGRPLMSSIAVAQRTFGRLLPPWWLLLLAGIGWMLVALIVLRFDYTSVSAISILFGIVAIFAGVFELVTLFLVRGWWKLLYAVLALVFIGAGIVAFIHPGDTFRALAAVFSFFLIFAGTFDIIVSIAARREIEVWWLQLITGIIELVLGFWAAGYYGRSAVLLVAWVAAIAIIRGVNNIVLAFRVREVQHAAAS
jgi:uncharacterized membrane protein HdeD (DUF308 family)